MKSSIPSRFDPYRYALPQRPRPRIDATTVALTSLVIIVAWLAMIGLGTVIIWGLR